MVTSDRIRDESSGVTPLLGCQLCARGGMVHSSVSISVFGQFLLKLYGVFTQVMPQARPIRPIAGSPRFSKQLRTSRCFAQMLFK